jgi:hypothetical protein
MQATTNNNNEFIELPTTSASGVASSSTQFTTTEANVQPTVANAVTNVTGNSMPAEQEFQAFTGLKCSYHRMRLTGETQAQLTARLSDNSMEEQAELDHLLENP